MNEDEVTLKLKSLLNDTGFRSMDKEIKAAESSMSALGGPAMMAGKAIAAGIAIGGVALGAFAVKATMMASDIGESQSKVNVVFGESADVINELAATSATALGMTKAEVLSAAGGVGNLLTAMGQSKEKAAEMSVEMVKLATDLGSFNNANSTDVLAAMQAAMAGETEAMKKYGVAINENTLKQAAMEEGLGSNVQALSASEKQMLTMKIMMEQTTSAQGDFERTSTGLANSMKIIKSSFSDVVAEIGQKLLPTVQTAASGFATGFADAKAEGLDPVAAAVTGVYNALVDLGLDGWAAKILVFRDKWLDVVAAFESGGFQEAFEEIVGFDLDPLIEAFGKTKDAILVVGEKLLALGGFLVKHKGVVMTVVAAYVAFKAVLAIQDMIGTVKGALEKAAVAWSIYASGGWTAVAAMIGLDVAMLPIIATIAAIVVAVGALYLAWKHWDLIKEKTEAVVNWFMSIPLYFQGAFDEVIAGVMALVAEWAIIWATIKEDPIKGINMLIDWLKEIPAKLLQIGKDIVAGLLEGIKAAWGGLMDWWRGANREITSSAAEEVGAASPATKMIPIGRWIIEGEELGMKLAAPGMIKTARQIAQDAMAALGDMGGGNEGAGIGAARRAVETLSRRIWEARDGFLTGGESQEGSLAWMVKKWDTLAPDFGKVFAALDVPVADVREFVTYIERLSVEDPERATVEWGKFWDAMKTQQEKVHDARIKGIDDAAKRTMAIIELERRHFEWVQDQEAQSAAKPGGTPVGQKTEYFSDDKERIAAALQPILDMLGDKDLAGFWKRWNDDIGANINTTEDLNKAIDAVMTAAGRHYDGLRDAEDANNDAVMKNLEAQAAFIQTLIDSRTTAEADLEELVALRQALLDAAADKIRAEQAAQEAFEDRVHDGIMAAIAAEREARNAAHEARMGSLKLVRKAEVDYHNDVVAGLNAARKAAKDVHDERIGQIDAAEKRINDNIKKQELEIGTLKQNLAQFTIDIGYDDAVAQLTALQEHVQSLVEVAASFKIDPRGREALDAQRAAKVDRVVVTSDAQRAALQAAKDAGTLTDRQARVVDLALGGGRMRAAEIQAILGKGIDAATAAAAAQQGVIDGMNAEIALRQQVITLAEQKLAADKANADIVLAALDELRAKENLRWETEVSIRDQMDKAEEARHTAELGRIDGLIAAEQALFDAEMDYLERMAKAEDDRHADRMAAIAEEAAFKLASLGMGPDEIAKMIEAAQRISGEIAEQVRKEMERILAEMPIPGEGVGGGSGGPRGGAGGGGGSPGGPVPGLPLGGGAGGSFVLDVTGVEAKEATVKEVNFGGMQITQRATLVLPSGRELALETVEAMLEDIELVDRLGRKIDERKSQTGQLGGSP